MQQLRASQCNSVNTFLELLSLLWKRKCRGLLLNPICLSLRYISLKGKMESNLTMVRFLMMEERGDLTEHLLFLLPSPLYAQLYICKPPDL